MTHRRSRGRPRHPDLLTPAEWAVLDLVRHGLRRSEIAARRRTSVEAVKYHLANIRDKLGIRGTDLRRWPGVPATSAAFRRSRSAVEPSSPSAVGPIGQVSLMVRDIDRATRFYAESLGLRHLFTFGDLAFFDAHGVRIYLHRKGEAEWRPGSVLYFAVPEILATQEALAARGVQFPAAPHRIHTHDDGTEEWMTFFDDGEGNALALMARVAPGSEAQATSDR